MRSLQKSAFTSVILTLAVASIAPAQVGAPPTAPTTLWNMLGIPYGLRKLQGATRNRRGNNPNREPKPPLKALADPRNLESPDPSIKKAAEVKQAEDLKKQKIKAVKYLAQVGCGCYDADGGVTDALVASMGDCTEDVRYETIKAIGDAAEGECCANCGKVCCCNQKVLTEMAKLAYERDDHGCYVEPSQRVREEAAKTLRICCPNETSPLIVSEPEPDQGPQRETGEPGITDPERESDSTTPTPPDGPEELPSADDDTARFQRLRQAKPIIGAPITAAPSAAESMTSSTASGSVSAFDFGVIVHVSPEHGLAHVHFNNAHVQPPVGAIVGVYEQVGDKRMLMGKFQVVESFAGSANVTGSQQGLARIARGDVALCKPVAATAQRTAVASSPVQGAPRSATLGTRVKQSLRTAKHLSAANGNGVQANPAEARPVRQQLPVVRDADATVAAEAQPVRPVVARQPLSSSFMR